MTFGVQRYRGDWTAYDVENLQAKSIGWNATYMLGMNQNTVERSAEKEAIFKAFRTWENARNAGVFTQATRQKLADLGLKFHLEQTGEKSFLLSLVKEIDFTANADTQTHPVEIKNPYDEQPLQFAVRFMGPRDSSLDGFIVTLPGGEQLKTTQKLAAGEFVICKGNTAYVADRFRRKIADLELPHAATLSAGSSTLSVQTLGASAPDKSRFEVTVWAVGPLLPVPRRDRN